MSSEMRLKIFFLFVLQIAAKYGKVLNPKVKVAKYETDLKKLLKTNISKQVSNPIRFGRIKSGSRLGHS